MKIFLIVYREGWKFESSRLLEQITVLLKYLSIQMKDCYLHLPVTLYCSVQCIYTAYVCMYLYLTVLFNLTSSNDILKAPTIHETHTAHSHFHCIRRKNSMKGNF